MLEKMKNMFKGKEKTKTIPAPKTIPADTNYTDTGLPKEVARKGEGMSENDYENLRKVL